MNAEQMKVTNIQTGPYEYLDPQPLGAYVTVNDQ